jgi:sulfotransferase
MDKTFYFMAGLPRSGSTLLSSILNQNPRFHSGPSSPVVPLMLVLENDLNQDELFLAYPKMDQARKIISSVLENYYSDVTRPVVFDKNRSWVNRPEYIRGYFDIEPKILCPVRSIDEILTSFIMMCRRNPYNGKGKINFIDSMLIKSDMELTDDNRCRVIAGPGILGQSVDGIRRILEQGQDKILHFIEYQDLVHQPEQTMRKVYEYLEEEYYAHDFSKLENIHRENDQAVYGFSDMHEVREALSIAAPKPSEILSPEILAQCVNSEFWRNITTENNTTVVDTQSTVIGAASLPIIDGNQPIIIGDLPQSVDNDTTQPS